MRRNENPGHLIILEPGGCYFWPIVFLDFDAWQGGLAFRRGGIFRACESQDVVVGKGARRGSELRERLNHALAGVTGRAHGEDCWCHRSEIQ